VSSPTANNNNPTAALGAMPPEIAAQLREIGPGIEAPKEPHPWLKVARDLKYGPAERNVLDVFSAPFGGGKPVVVFVHALGFARGAKRIEGTPFYVAPRAPEDERATARHRRGAQPRNLRRRHEQARGSACGGRAHGGRT
jgi:hypothetical protein